MVATWVTATYDGGLGNRLFKYAAALGTAERWGRQAVIYMPLYQGSNHGPFDSLLRLFPSCQMVLQSVDSPLQIYEELPKRHWVYVEFPQEPPTLPAVLKGYWQSPRYFPADLGGLTPNWSFALGGPEAIQTFQASVGLATEEARRNTVSLHVRLGDYTICRHHQENLGLYYWKAIQRIAPGSHVRLFSDEPEACKGVFKKLLASREIRMTVAEVRTDYLSLYEMSLCLGGNITANSSFSWWGAWFAHEAGSPWATFPDRWGAGFPDQPKDLFPSWATVVPVA